MHRRSFLVQEVCSAGGSDVSAVNELLTTQYITAPLGATAADQEVFVGFLEYTKNRPVDSDTPLRKRSSEKFSSL